VQAIVDFVHNHITFGYPHADVTRTAYDAFTDGKGVCRDFAHLAITLCRCRNVPARYCTGYLGDIGVPPTRRRWISARGSRLISATAGTRSMRATTNPHRPHLIARGRDATDVAITTSFGPHALVSFKVVTDEVKAPETAPA
jgi:transglutaminase-like putative cysteine protease